MQQEKDYARYELSLALHNILKMIRHMPLKRDELKRYHAAEAMLKKHSKITDVLRTESNEQPVEQKESEAVGKFLEWVYENGITRHSNGHWYKWDNGNAKEKYYADDNQHICELYQNKQ